MIPTSPASYAFCHRQSNVKLRADDLDIELVMPPEATVPFKDTSSAPYSRSWVWGVDETFKAFIESEPRDFEYEFVDEFPTIEINSRLTQVNARWSQHEELSGRNEDRTPRQIFQRFLDVWTERRKVAANKTKAKTKFKFLLGSVFHSGLCVPGDICSVSKLSINMDILVEKDGKYVSILKPESNEFARQQ